MRFERRIGLLVMGFFMAACDGGGTSSTGGSGGAPAGGSGGTGASVSNGGSGGTGAATSTGGSGGSAGGTSQGGSGGSTSTGGTGGSGGSGGACQWNLNNPCGSGQYCNAPSCGMGTCEPVGTVEEDGKMPVCGCDGVTYWNASVAGSHGMAVSGNGECGPAATKQCGGFGGIQCPPGAYCNYEVKNQAGCGIADGGGTCWGVPKTCGGGVGFGPNTRECGMATCLNECELIKKETLWYVDNTCPQ